MAMLREWASRVWGTLRRTRPDADLQEELRLHLELAADDARRRGESPERARRAARLHAGHLPQALEAMRDQRALPWVEDLGRDLRYGCRMLAHHPSFTVVAVVSLAIGIGANSAAFSFADALLLRPLPVPHPGGVVTVGSAAAVDGFSTLVASYPEYRDIRDRSRTFEGLVAFMGTGTAFAATPSDTPRLRVGLLVSGNFFSVMGVDPQTGRAFRPDEDQVPGRNAVLVLGHDFWQQQFAGDPGVLGRTVRLNGVDFTIVGVAPRGFTGLSQFARVDFYAPLLMQSRLLPESTARAFEDRDSRGLVLKGRLKPGVSLADAQAELTIIGADLERAYPATNRNRRLMVRTELQARLAHDQIDGVVIGMLTTLAGIVLFVACANVAGLLASRAPVRAREIAMRLAIGASRPRLVRQLVAESLLLALAGGVLGVGLGSFAVRAFNTIRIPTDLPISLDFQLDRRALLFSLVVAMVSALLFGLVPAIQATRADLAAVMRANDRTTRGRRRWGRAILVVGQVAASVVVLVVATFMYRNFQRQLGAGPGYRTDHVLMMSLDPTLVRSSEPRTEQLFAQVIDRARQVPGVKSAALASSIPMGSDGFGLFSIVPDGYQFPAGKDSASVLGAVVDEGYFETLGLSIVSGRAFRATDRAGAPWVAVVNELVARHYWPNQDAIGKRFRLAGSGASPVEVVGVEKTSKYTFLAERPTEFLYLPYGQRPQPRMMLLAQSVGDPASLVTPLAEIVHGLDASQPIYNVRTMEEFYRLRVITAFNVIIGTVAAMGLMGLALSIVGLYGLVAYGVSRRRKEIGIRLAIGAGRSSVMRMVIRQGMRLAAGGLVLGLLAGVGARRVLAAAFGNRNPTPDVAAFLIVAGVVSAVTLLATYVPARRAALINPTDALRNE